MSDVMTVHEKNGSAAAPGIAKRSRRVAPNVDVFENADELLVIADVPGAAGDGIELRVENDTLTLEARGAQENDPGPALAREYEPVSYVARFRIPAGIDASAVSAETKNGTLTVRLPKAAAAKPRKIAVRSSAS
jgi:HSP20 family molecular chaperone IbpA